MQKAFPEVRAALGSAPDLFVANLRTVLKIRIAAIATRISARKLNVGISQLPIGVGRHQFHRHKCWKRIATQFGRWSSMEWYLNRGRQSRPMLTQNRRSWKHGNPKNGRRAAGRTGPARRSDPDPGAPRSGPWQAPGPTAKVDDGGEASRQAAGEQSGRMKVTRIQHVSLLFQTAKAAASNDILTQ